MKLLLVPGLLGVIIGFALGMFIPGFILISTFLKDELTKLERLVFSVAVSFGILHVIMTGMAALRVELSFYNILSVELIVTVSSFLLWFRKMKRDRTHSKSNIIFDRKEWSKSLRPYLRPGVLPFLLFTTIALFLMLFHIIQIPIIHTYDGLIYEQISKYIFEKSRYPWPIFPDAIYAPQYAYVYEMRHILTLCSWMYMCYGSVENLFPMLTVFFIGIITLITLFSMSLRRNRSLSSAIIAPALMILTDSFVRQSTDVHNDVPFLFFWVVTTYSFYLLIRKKKRNLMLLSGALLGFLIITKIQALIFPLIIMGYFLSELAFSGRDSLFEKIKSLKWVIGTLIIGASISSIYFINNWILNGNPLYPFFVSILGGDPWTAKFLHVTDMLYRRHEVSPFSLEYVTNRILGFLRLGQFRYEPNPIIAVFCALGFMVLASNIRNRQDKFLLINSLFFFLFWFFSADFGHRLLLPVYALLLVPFSGLVSSQKPSCHKIQRKKYNLRRHIGTYFKVLCLIAILLPSTCTILQLTKNDVYMSKVLWKNGGANLYSIVGGRNVYLTAVGIYYVLEPDMNFFLMHFMNPPDKETVSKLKFGDLYNVGVFINTKLPKNAVILTTDNRAFHFSERRMIWDGNKGINQIYLKKNFKKVLGILKSHGVTHFLYGGGAAFESEREMMGLQNTPLMNNLNDAKIFKVVWKGNKEGKISLKGPIILYEINYTSCK